MYEKKYHIAIVGPKENISLFAASGAVLFPAQTPAEALSLLRDIKRGEGAAASLNVAVVILIEELRERMRDDEYDKAVSGALPAVVIIPSGTARSGESTRRIRALAERAVGMDVL